MQDTEPSRPASPIEEARNDPAGRPFFELAEVFIRAANEQSTPERMNEVSAALLFAAARYNAFATAVGSGGARALAERRAETIRYFMQQYEYMLEDNLTDYERNFDRYLKST